LPGWKTDEGGRLGLGLGLYYCFGGTWCASLSQPFKNGGPGREARGCFLALKTFFFFELISRRNPRPKGDPFFFFLSSLCLFALELCLDVVYYRGITSLGTPGRSRSKQGLFE